MQRKPPKVTTKRKPKKAREKRKQQRIKMPRSPKRMMTKRKLLLIKTKKTPVIGLKKESPMWSVTRSGKSVILRHRRSLKITIKIIRKIHANQESSHLRFQMMNGRNVMKT
jgi:hypothetical protein